LLEIFVYIFAGMDLPPRHMLESEAVAVTSASVVLGHNIAEHGDGKNHGPSCRRLARLYCFHYDHACCRSGNTCLLFDRLSATL